MNPKGVLTIALNKSDLVEAEQLNQLVQIVQDKGLNPAAGLYQTSAKTGASVDEMFKQLADTILKA